MASIKTDVKKIKTENIQAAEEMSKNEKERHNRKVTVSRIWRTEIKREQWLNKQSTLRSEVKLGGPKQKVDSIQLVNLNK